MTLQSQLQEHHQLGGHPFDLFKRTECTCEICKNNCKVIPGYLIWKDLAAIYQELNPSVNFNNFIKLYFLASPGAIVIRDNIMYRIPTIVPKRNDKGYCIFLNEHERCKIHKVAPFGCRYFDHSQTKEEGDNISKFGLFLIQKDPCYKQTWKELWDNNLIAIPPEEARKAFKNGW